MQVFASLAQCLTFPQADLRTKEDGEECEEFLAAEAQVVSRLNQNAFPELFKMEINQVKEAEEQLKVE